MVKTASLYDNFCKTGNDVIIWVQDGNCKKWLENSSISAFYNITKIQDNLIKTVGRDSFLSPKSPKIGSKALKYKFFRRHPARRGRTAPIFKGHN